MASKRLWGIWITTQNDWLMDTPKRKARYTLKREAAKEANEFNTMWRGRKHKYEARKIK